METEQILTATKRLVDHLRSFADQDRERGIEAAEIIERTLRLFAQQPESAASRLRYDIGGKGLLDWCWSPAHRAQLELLSHELFILLQAPSGSAHP